MSRKGLRHAGAWLCGLLLGAVCLGQAAPVWAEEPDPTPPYFGIQLLNVTGQQAALPAAGQASIGIIRMNLSWAEIEPQLTEPPTFQWAKYDALLGGPAQAGMQMIITVRDNPAWAASTACGPIDKAPVSHYLDFLDALVTRYSAAPYGITLWELYNEPDNNHPEMYYQGGCWGQHAAAYAALLAQAQPVIHAADPQARLLLGGLAFDFIEGYDAGGVFNGNFLNELLAAPGGGSFDIMNFHYYRAFHTRWDRHGTDVIGKTAYIRAELAKRGLSRPIIITEIGHPSEGPASDGQNYSEAESSRYLVQAFVRGRAADLLSMTWFEMMDGPYDERKYGLLRSDLSPKPSHTAYSVLTDELGGATFLQNDSTTTLERYRFQAGALVKTVAWSKSTQFYDLAFAGAAIWVVDRLGVRQIVADGSTGDRDGQNNAQVSVRIGPDPLYIYPVSSGSLPRRAVLPRLPHHSSITGGYCP